MSDLYLSRIRINEQAGENVRFTKTSDGCTNNRDVCFYVEAAFRCDLVRLFGYQGYSVWFGLEGDFEHFLSRGHFQIQISSDYLPEKLNIFVLDVTPIA